MDALEEYYQLNPSMRGPSAFPPGTQNHGFSSDRNSGSLPHYTASAYSPMRKLHFNSYKRKHTSVFQKQSVVSPIGSTAQWGAPGSSYVSLEGAGDAPLDNYRPPSWNTQRNWRHESTVNDAMSLGNVANFLEDPRKPNQTSFGETGPHYDQGYGYSHSNQIERNTYHGLSTIQPTHHLPYASSRISIGDGSIHSVSPVSLTGSESLVSQGSGRMIEPNKGLSRQRNCLYCAFSPDIRLWPCGCCVCSKCAGGLLQALSTRQTGHPDENISRGVLFGASCPSCFEPVMNIFNLQDIRATSMPYYQHTMNQYSKYQVRPQIYMSAATDRASSSAVSGHESGYPPAAKSTNTSGRIPFVELGTGLHALDADSQSPPQPLEAGVVKIENIPYNLTESVLREFLGKGIGILPEECGGGVHIVMDRTTGKTMDCFLEFLTVDIAQRFIDHRMSNSRRCILGGRHVTLELVDSKVLMKWLFPKVKGATWTRMGTLSRLEQGKDDVKVEILSREELVMIVGHARTPHRSPFSRKCLQRPYESLLSILLKFPWYATELYTLKQRDYIFKAVYDSIDLLIKHIKRGRTAPNLDDELLRKLCRIAIKCSGFTDKQKRDIVALSELSWNDFEGCFEFLRRGPLDGMFQALGVVKGADDTTIQLISQLLLSSTSQLQDTCGTHQSSVQDGQQGSDLTVHDNGPQTLDENLTLKQAARIEWEVVNKALAKYFSASS